MVRIKTLLFISFLLLLVSGCSKSTNENVNSTNQVINEHVDTEVCYNDKCREVEIADEVKEQQRGLMNRTTLDKDAGMLFVFPKLGSRQFWMKDTLIPLDIIWLDGDGKVIYISENTPPCKTPENCPGYGPTSKNALFVLEINAGQVFEYGIITGSVFKLPN